MLNYIWFGMMAIAVAAGIYNGKIDAVMNCTEQGISNRMTMQGTYAPESYDMTMAMEGTQGEQQGMRMQMRVNARRVGECTGDEIG